MKAIIKTIRQVIFFSIIVVASVSQLHAETDVKALIEKASSARQQASKLGFEWTATEGLIKSAKDALAEGKTELAKTLAARALKQAENGIKQAEYSDKHWQDNLPK